ncbi:hypothetical protein [Paraburkholderia atlantica]|uniref:hypothetical protein n=1 Tax=Paraburkholderia atlantica TaxID=2654982 RepID=UPI0012FEA32C|nr:hypothetical protein [Paraburkholderia atlantica]
MSPFSIIRLESAAKTVFSILRTLFSQISSERHPASKNAFEWHSQNRNPRIQTGQSSDISRVTNKLQTSNSMRLGGVRAAGANWFGLMFCLNQFNQVSKREIQSQERFFTNAERKHSANVLREDYVFFYQRKDAIDFLFFWTQRATFRLSVSGVASSLSIPATDCSPVSDPTAEFSNASTE